MRSRTFALATITAVLVIASCSSDDGSSAGTAAPTPVASSDSASTTSTEGTSPIDVVAGAAFPDERCAANEAAGTITFLTGFDFAAAASIVDVIAADEAGYYEDLCLDVEILPGFSSANYPLVAAGNAQFASGGSFAEVVNFANANDARFLATATEGRTAIDTLIMKAGTATELAEIEGLTIGVKGKLPPSVDVMLRGAGLVEGDDFDTVLLDGFDPIAHIALPIDGLPGWKSNEVGALEREGVGIQLFDPLDFGVPGSFGVIFTSAEFAEEHPTAAEDFMRASMRGLADAISDPTAAANTAVERITAGGNPNFLSPEGEVFRWETEADLIQTGTPEGLGFGVPDARMLQAELDAYASVDLFGEGVTPDASGFIGDEIMSAIYDGDTLIWPA